MYLDLFEPYPREERRIKGKDPTPSGYNLDSSAVYLLKK